ncbi:MAG: GntR family transcriptional regulator [Eubacteriales bacterium]|nr:GntR family transcriptional regulator [Eubacteriales bacterium]
MVEFPAEIVEMYKDFKPAHQKIYRIIKDSIYSGKLQTKEKFTEEAIAKALGCSRTPVRTALQKLQADGLLQNVTRNNYGLKVFSEKEIRDLMELDQLLEGRAAYLAAQRGISEDDMETLEEINDMLGTYEDFKARPSGAYGDGARDLHTEFHMLIGKLSGNQFLYKEIVTVLKQVRSLRLEAVNDANVERRSLLVDSGLHRNILEAIRDRDPSRAELMIRYEIDQCHMLYRNGK